MALNDERGTREFSSILTHYFREAWTAAGLSWDWENAGEIEDALKGFAGAIEAVIADEVARQVRAAIERRGRAGLNE